MIRLNLVMEVIVDATTIVTGLVSAYYAGKFLVKISESDPMWMIAPTALLFGFSVAAMARRFMMIALNPSKD